MAFSLEDTLYSDFKNVYNKSPQIFKNTVGRIYRSIPTSIKYGKIYNQYRTLLNESQWWSKKKIEKYQWERTKELLHHAYNSVPYYKKLFDERDLKLKDIQNFYDFKKVPYLTKDIIRKSGKELLSTNYKKKNFIKVTTGSTTGPPLNLWYESGVSRSMENAFMVNMWKRYGYELGDKIVVIRGEIIKNINQKSPSFYDPIRNRLIISSYHMIEENIPFYVHKIREFRPKFLHVYPSSLTLLAQFMKKENIKPIRSVKGILASSETMHDWQVQILEEVFDCRVFHWYGLSELVALAGVCEVSNCYHIYPEYSYVEYVKPDDENIVNEERNIVELVGTSFCNNAMPLIRYRTQDYAIEEKNDCQCGRNYLLIKNVLGRKQDFFIDKTGSKITFTGMTRPVRLITDKITAYQYRQDKPGSVTLNIELKQSLSENDRRNVTKTFNSIYPRFDFQINTVAHIPRTKSGKFLYLRQNIQA